MLQLTSRFTYRNQEAQKLVGKDIVCKNNIDWEKELSLTEPYRITHVSLNGNISVDNGITYLCPERFKFKSN